MSSNGNSGWSLAQGVSWANDGEYYAPWTANNNTPGNSDYWGSKTFTLNPGSYWLSIDPGPGGIYNGTAPGKGYGGTVTIT